MTNSAHTTIWNTLLEAVIQAPFMRLYKTNMLNISNLLYWKNRDDWDETTFVSIFDCIISVVIHFNILDLRCRENILGSLVEGPAVDFYFFLHGSKSRPCPANFDLLKIR